MSTIARTLRRHLLVAAASLSFCFQAHATLTDIHNEPLAQAVSSVKPNIMFVLDDSLSMYFQWLPDYVTDWSSNVNSGSFKHCRPDADSNGVLRSSLVHCRFGDVPYNAYEFNAQNYNPNNSYRPSPLPGGTDSDTRIMNAANTSNWTQVPNDAYGVNNRDVTYIVDSPYTSTAAQTNLVTGIPIRVWCTDRNDDVNNDNLCKTNADHTYPNATYKYGYDNDGNIKYRNGAPYYYKSSTAEYCTTSGLTTCQATEDATYTVRAPIRFCTNSDQTSCRAKRSGTYTYPSFAGKLNPSTLVIGARATATLTVGDSGSNSSVTLNSLLANSISLLSYAVTAPGGTNSSTERNTAAAAIRDSINAANGTHGFIASSNNNVVTVTAPVEGVSYNGVALQASVGAGTARARGTLTVVDIDSSNTASRRQISSIRVDGTEIFNTTLTLTANNETAAATAIAERINSYSNGTPWEYTASASQKVVTISAPINVGALANGLSISATYGREVELSFTDMSGGISGTSMPVSTSSFSGGVTSSGSVAYWESRINFERVDIVETASGLPKTFPRGPDRIDCANTTYCTYAEEMTNYANWYSYYRTRMQAAKSSSARAFSSVSDSVRVGFITIGPMSGGSVSANKYLRVDTFNYNSGTDSGHKKDWYNKLYGSIFQITGTPLREALSRVGRLYAGKFDEINTGIPAADDPVLYSCQPNFTILTTDGYWNGNAGKQINGTDNVGNEDNTDSGYSKRVDGVYDGGGNSASGTLADVALYYYKNDLRDTMADTVFTTTKDTAQHQHMTTFTLGLGLSGALTYDPEYESQSVDRPGDFYAIKQGTKNWPVPAENTETTLDDLWHAAVNGRGTFYSAANPQQFSNALSDAITQMFARGGAGAAAATSNLQPTAGDNFAFTAEYETQTWRGDLVARTIDTTNGVVSNVALWSAASLLDARNYADRRIYTFDSSDTTATVAAGSGNRLKHLCWPSGSGICTDGSGLSVTEQGYFATTRLGQSANWNALQLANASAINLLAYLRGDRSNETTGGNDSTDLYRSRASALGDIINSQPAYIKTSPFNYETGTNPHYQTFKTSTASRRGTVFAAANDGMLHAFETDVNGSPYYQTAGISTDSTADDVFTGTNTGNGAERWAYVPGVVLPNLYKLAETPYSHRFFADGSPVIGDVCSGHTTSTPCADANSWRTILVAGFNSGGRGYYALDITDPINPKALWEFTSTSTCLTDAQISTGDYYSDCNMGLSYGNPLIVKRPSDDRWVVIVSSGYNNVNPGDGQGYLYILDAISGKILQRMSTGVGSGGTAGASYADAVPSGLGKINGWATNAIENNKVLAVYGGDLLGNLWRFDLDPSSANYNTVFKLAALKDGLSNPQPITVKPELGEVTPYRIVLLGTGRYLGTSDTTNLSDQTIYAIRDDHTTTEVVVRTDLLQRNFAASGTTARTAASATSMDWLTKKGWYIDLPDDGERVNIDPQLQLGTLIVASNVPSTDSCTAGGYAWLNYFDYRQGTQVSTNNASVKIGNALVVGLSTIKIGTTVHTIVTTADNKRTTTTPPVSSAVVGGRRVSWREIIAE